MKKHQMMDDEGEEGEEERERGMPLWGWGIVSCSRNDNKM